MLQSNIDVSGLRLQPQGENRLGQGIAAFGAGLAEMSRKRKEAEKVKQFSETAAPMIAEAFGVDQTDAAKMINADPRNAMAVLQFVQAGKQQQAAQQQKARQEDLDRRVQVLATTGDKNALQGLSAGDSAAVEGAAWDLSNKRQKAHLDAQNTQSTIDERGVTEQRVAQTQQRDRLIDTGAKYLLDKGELPDVIKEIASEDDLLAMKVKADDLRNKRDRENQGLKDQRASFLADIMYANGGVLPPEYAQESPEVREAAKGIYERKKAGTNWLEDFMAAMSQMSSGAAPNLR